MNRTSFALFLLAFSLQLATGLAQNTVFTYQGRVRDNGTNFYGTGQFQFALVTSTNVNQTATATADVARSGAVTAVLLPDGGSGYVTAPTVTITGNGSGATATATVSNGAVTTSPSSLSVPAIRRITPPSWRLRHHRRPSLTRPIGATTARVRAAASRRLWSTWA